MNPLINLQNIFDLANQAVQNRDSSGNDVSYSAKIDDYFRHVRHNPPFPELAEPLTKNSIIQAAYEGTPFLQIQDNAILTISDKFSFVSNFHRHILDAAKLKGYEIKQTIKIDLPNQKIFLIDADTPPYEPKIPNTLRWQIISFIVLSSHKGITARQIAEWLNKDGASSEAQTYVKNEIGEINRLFKEALSLKYDLIDHTKVSTTNYYSLNYLMFDFLS